MNIITTKDNTSNPFISFFNATSSYLLQTGDLLTLKLDIDKKHIIQDIAFSTKANLDQFDLDVIDAVLKNTKNKNARYCTEISWLELLSNELQTKSLPFFNIPLILLKDALAGFFGRVPSFGDGVPYSESDLACRCFGVYKEQAQNSFANIDGKKKVTLNDFCATTKATLGCGSCQKDFSKIFNDFNKSESNQTLVYHTGLTQSEFALVCDQFIKEWLREKKIALENITLVDIHHYSVFCKVLVDELTFYKISKDFEEKFQTQLVRLTLQ